MYIYSNTQERGKLKYKLQKINCRNVNCANRNCVNVNVRNVNDWESKENKGTGSAWFSENKNTKEIKKNKAYDKCLICRNLNDWRNNWK